MSEWAQLLCVRSPGSLWFQTKEPGLQLKAISKSKEELSEDHILAEPKGQRNHGLSGFGQTAKLGTAKESSRTLDGAADKSGEKTGLVVGLPPGSELPAPRSGGAV